HTIAGIAQRANATACGDVSFVRGRKAMRNVSGASLVLTILVAMVLFSSAPVWAHHGAGTFELNKSVTFTGTLTRIELINPHSWIYFEVKESDGTVSKHRCEMRSAHTL